MCCRVGSFSALWRVGFRLRPRVNIVCDFALKLVVAVAGFVAKLVVVLLRDKFGCGFMDKLVAASGHIWLWFRFVTNLVVVS